MKPFDLEKALAGEPVNVIGDTVPKRIIAKSAYHDNRYIIEDKHGAYTLPLAELQEGFEMWQAPRTRVQLDLPAPLKDVPNEQYLIYVIELINGKGCVREQISAFYLNTNRIFFSTKQDAQEWLDAMRNARR